MSDMPWVDKYEPRRWEVYRVAAGSSEEPKLGPLPTPICVCTAESDIARSHYEIGQRLPDMAHPHLYYDFEQLLAAKLDKVYGMVGPEALRVEWNGHPAGTMVLTTYAGVDQNPPHFTYLVEKTD